MSVLVARLGAEMLKGRECTSSHLLVLSHPSLPPGVLGTSSGAPECPARPLRQQVDFSVAQGDLELPILLPTLSVGITGKHHCTQFMLCKRWNSGLPAC